MNKAKPPKVTGFGHVVRVLLLLLGIFVLMAALCGGGFVYILYRSTQPVSDVGSDFLRAAADANYEQAFALLTDETQAAFGDPSALGEALTADAVEPTRWSFNSRSADEEVASLGSTVMMADGTEREVQIELVWTGNTWLISDFSFD